MAVEHQSDERKAENEQQSDQTERNEKLEKDFFTKILETSGQADDSKKIYIQYNPF